MRIVLIIIAGLVIVQGLFMLGMGKDKGQGRVMAADYEFKTYKYGPLSGGRPRQLVILLHGLGSDGRDLISLAPFFAKRLPDAIFVSPDAPFPCDMSPLGYQWFSLQDRRESAILAGVQAAAPLLDSYITDQMEKFAVPAARTALVGFSQGSMMALYVGPRFPEPLAGVLGYSGALIGVEASGGPDLSRIPIHLVHGDADEVVPVAAYHDAREALAAAGYDISGGVAHGLGHSIDEDGIEGGGAFLHRVLD